MNLKSWLIAIPQQGNTAHMQLFTKLKADKQDWSSREGNRLVQFVVINGIIIARVNQMPIEIPSVEYKIEVKNKQKVKLVIRWMRNNNKRKPPYTVTPQSDEKIMQSVSESLQQNGVNVESIDVVDVTPEIMFAKNKYIKLPAVDVGVIGEIQDVNKFAQAWYRGLGRYKTYGFGMIREKLL